MEIAFYEYAKSVKITGDAAIVFYMNEGKVFTKNLSYFDGDTLYPHYDSITGQMTLFARRYSDYDEEGKELISWVEVWDNKKCTVTGRIKGNSRSNKQSETVFRY